MERGFTMKSLLHNVDVWAGVTGNKDNGGVTLISIDLRNAFGESFKAFQQRCTFF